MCPISDIRYLISDIRIPGGEEGEDDAKSAWPSDTLGYTRGTIAATTGCDGEKP